MYTHFVRIALQCIFFSLGVKTYTIQSILNCAGYNSSRKAKSLANETSWSPNSPFRNTQGLDDRGTLGLTNRMDANPMQPDRAYDTTTGTSSTLFVTADSPGAAMETTVKPTLVSPLSDGSGDHNAVDTMVSLETIEETSEAQFDNVLGRSGTASNYSGEHSASDTVNTTDFDTAVESYGSGSLMNETIPSESLEQLPYHDQDDSEWIQNSLPSETTLDTVDSSLLYSAADHSDEDTRFRPEHAALQDESEALEDKQESDEADIEESEGMHRKKQS